MPAFPQVASRGPRAALTRRALVVLIALVAAVALFAPRSAAAAEPVGNVSAHLSLREGGREEINNVTGTLTSGSGTVVDYEYFQYCFGGPSCVKRSLDEIEGEVTCVDTAVVEGGEEAIIGGRLTKATSVGNRLPFPYFHFTVFDGANGGVADELSQIEPSNTPGCAAEVYPLHQIPASVNETPNDVSVTGAVAPQTRLVDFRAVDQATNESRPRIGYVATEPGSTFTCRFDEEALHACPATAKARPATELADGVHTFEVFATDAAGNVDLTPATTYFEVDTVAPETFLDEGPTGPIDTAEPRWNVSSNDELAGIECSLDGSAWEYCYLPYQPGGRYYPPLTEGRHTVRFRAFDRAGNVDKTPVKVTVTVDLQAPDTTITSAPASPTKNASPRIRFASSEPGSSFLCRFDAEPFGPCAAAASTVPPAPLADGPHTFEVEAVDKAGNVDASPAAVSFVVDTTPPETTIVSGGPVAGSPGKASFVAETTEGTLECKLDAAAWAPCTSPVVYEGLEAGTHTFKVRGVDPAGNVDPTPATQKFKTT
jgi:hypothetical protein